MTWLLISINVVVFIYMVALGESLRGVEFIFDYAFVPARWAAEPLGAAPTLISSMFMHGGWMHLLGNMAFLVVFGDNVEDRMGRFAFLAFYLLGGIAASLAHALLEGPSPVPLIGASGAISAVLGAYIVLYPRQRVLTFIPPLFLPWLVVSLFFRVPRFFLVWLPAWLFIGYWVVVQLFEAGARLGELGTGATGVAWWAHIGGFVVGLTLVKLFERRGAVAQGAGSISP